MLFFNFFLFHFSKLQMSKSYEKTILFNNGFRGFLLSSTRPQIFFDGNCFDNETTALWRQAWAFMKRLSF